MGRICLVTGGAGFVGMAVVKLLAKESVEQISHVKVLDLHLPDGLIKAVEAESSGPTFEWIVCDITKRSQVVEAMQGCDTVLHVASVIPGAFNDDSDTMWKVNVSGARNIVDACCECGVTSLAYVSSISIIGPNMTRKPVEYFDEDEAYDIHPRSYYGETKKAAEDYVLSANGRHIGEHKKLSTCALRPFLIYGQTFTQLRMCYKAALGNTLFSLCDADSKTSSVYVGNLAWAIINAGKRIEEKSSIAGGKFYYVVDDTPDQNYHNILASSFSVLGLSLSREPFLPFLMVYFLFWIIFVLSRIAKFIGMTSTTVPAPEYLWRLNTRFHISSRKLKDHFGFKPKFTPEHAIRKTGEYILRLKENNFDRAVYDFEY